MVYFLIHHSRWSWKTSLWYLNWAVKDVVVKFNRETGGERVSRKETEDVAIKKSRSSHHGSVVNEPD